MYEAQPTQPLSLRDTATGIAIRAGVLSIIGLVAGAWVFGLALKTAGAVVKVIGGLLLLTIGAGVVSLEVKSIQRRLEERSEIP